MVMLAGVLSLIIIIRVSVSINGKCILVLKSFRMPMPPALSSSLDTIGLFKFRCPSMLCLKASTNTGVWGRFHLQCRGFWVIMSSVPSTFLMISMISISSLVCSVRGFTGIRVLRRVL